MQCFSFLYCSCCPIFKSSSFFFFFSRTTCTTGETKSCVNNCVLGRGQSTMHRILMHKDHLDNSLSISDFVFEHLASFFLCFPFIFAVLSNNFENKNNFFILRYNFIYNQKKQLLKQSFSSMPEDIMLSFFLISSHLLTRRRNKKQEVNKLAKQQQRKK